MVTAVDPTIIANVAETVAIVTMRKSLGQSPLGWEHINLTGDYIWDLRQTTTLQRLRALRRSIENLG